jgi:hypothetical protein
MPLPIQQSKLFDSIRKRLGVQGSPRPQLIDDVFGVFDFTEVDPDVQVLAGINRYIARAQIAAGGAGQWSYAALDNGAVNGGTPTTHVLTLEGFYSLNPQSACITPLIRSSAGVGWTLQNLGLPLDDRLFGVATGSQGQTFFLSSATPGNTAAIIPLIAGWNPFVFVIPPGGAFALVPGAANTLMDITYVWRARPFLPEEAQL